MLAILDGTVSDASEARIPVSDDGLLRGDGVFEVIRLYGGRPFALDDHLVRLANSAANLRLPVDVDAVRADIETLVEANDELEAAMRVVITRGGHRLVMVEALKPLPATLAVVSIEYAPTRVLDGVKSLSYAANVLARRLAQERGADEALLVTPHGRILEAPTATFFWVRDGRLLTPPLEDGILASITRDRLLAECDVEEIPATLDDVRAAQEAFIASSVREVMPVTAVDEIEIPDASGPVTRAAHEALTARIVRELAVAGQEAAAAS
jgi:branched-chain amino acid aminotransferase